ncbi:hypothetical protein P3X46_015271 [Hevea brasiliensis]|uniref:PHD-type domain-containing protein n=1 Tax=Hevea brasiliensis TaxID=3981 RepID=A0ABQ9LWQ4_HEVBR|nr:uncharacterized protein LOC110645185 isoform X2 [Hevea brasiliensis]KAJ9171978.1 hypothetical protein P3X46_015271 [Hevea brasiliensis]
MREGLPSRVQLLAKTDESESSPCQATVKMEVGSTEEKGFKSTDGNSPKLIGSTAEEDVLVSVSKEETEMNQIDGSSYGECGTGRDTGEDIVVECSNNLWKRSRIDDEGESEDDSVKKQRVKDDAVDGELQVVGRVLRSGSTVKSDGGQKDEGGQSNDGFVGKKTRRGAFEEKRAKVQKEESGYFDGRDSYQSGSMKGKKLVRKRGRPPKSLKCEFQEKWSDVIKEDIEQSAGRKGVKRLKIQRGRPPKALENYESEKKWGDVEKEGIGLSASQASCQRKRRGRPPKAQGSDLSEKKRVELEEEEVNQSAGDESEMRKNLKHKFGRPPKARDKDGCEKKWGEVEKEGIGLSANHQTKNEDIEKFKSRRGRPPKAQGSDLSKKKGVEVEEEECDQSAGEMIEQPNNEVRENSKLKRGGQSKAQKSDGSVIKMVEVANEESEQPACKEGDESYGKVRKKLELNRGRPSKVNKSKKVHALRKNKLVKHNAHVMNHNVGNNSSLSGKGFGKEYNMKLLPDKKINCSNDENEGGKTKHKAGEMGHRRLQRQAVRDKIVELLLGAGWEIQYRPRNGTEYKDAVYVNPEGRTHWSVTLAYRVLKKHYEDGEGNSNTCKSDFKFTPIPDEELSILTKVINKERSDKNKKKKKWNQEKVEGEKTTEVVTKRKKWKLHKRKLGALAGVSSKKLKGRTKLKSTHRRQNDSACTPDQGAAVSVRDPKRLETHGRKRCALKARNSQEGTKSESDGYVLYNGKRTVLAWMIDLGTVLLYEKVQYLKRRKTGAVLRGRITTDGIQCDCCSKTFTIAEFEAHAGGKSCQPFKNIYLETGSSLFQCQLDSWLKQDESSLKGFHFVDIDGEDPNDDTCGICGDGGNLICCDGCPSTFHQSCLEIKFPSGLWHCIFCLCKFCGMASRNTYQRDDNNASPSLALLTCCLCEDKYHQPCAHAKDAISDDPDSLEFCGKKCKELYNRLQVLFGVKQELDEGFSWTFLRRFDIGPDVSLSGMPQKVECNSKLAVALHVMDECFLPMVDHRSGVNLIRNIVYNFGSNFNRLNYSGFFTAILEREDEIIAAASIRIHGNYLAEMPFIGTRYMYRRQGMCRRLLCAIEMALYSLNVEKLVIPAVSELRETWTSVFGFKPLEGVSKKILRNMNMLVFPGVDMLQKPLQGLESAELGELHTMEDMTNNFVGKSSAGFDLKGSTETGMPHSCNMINELAAVEPVSLLTDGCLNDTSEAAIQSANTTKCHELGVNSDNLDGRIESIVEPHDSSNDIDEQCGNEIVNNSDERYSAGFHLKGSSETSLPHANSIIGESAVVESGSLLPDGCFNDTSEVGIQSANTTKCHESGLTSDNLDGGNKSIVEPHDSSHDIDEQCGNEMINNSEGRYSTGFDLKGSSYTSKITGEPAAASLFLDGCLNNTSDISIQGVNNTKCCVQSTLTSDILEGGNANIVNPLDSLCNAGKKTEDEMINNCDGSDSGGFDLAGSSVSYVACSGNVIGEPAAAESGRLAATLSEPSNLTIQDRNKIKCHDQSVTISNNLDGRNENIVSPPDSVCDAYEQVAKITVQQNSLPASIILPIDNALQELHVQLNVHNASKMESKLPVVSHIGSEAANCLQEFPCASSGSTEIVCCEVKIEVSNVEHNLDSVGEYFMHANAQIISSKSQDLASEHGVKDLDDNAVLHESKTSNISCDIVKSTSSEAHQRAQDALNEHFASLPVEQNTDNSNCDDLCHVTASDINVKPIMHGCMNNALRMSREIASSSCGDGFYELKDVSATTQSDALSLDGGLISDKAYVNTKLLKPPSSDSESMCSSSSASGVAFHCASGGGNSCDTSEVIILSNQAS